MDTNTAKRSSRIDPHKPEHEPGIVQAATRNSQPVYSLDLGLLDYQEAWALQQKLVSARVDKNISRDMILFLEHPSVFTLGRRGGLDNLLV